MTIERDRCVDRLRALPVVYVFGRRGRGPPSPSPGAVSLRNMPRYDCISLTTDYGLSDGFVAACHGVLARR